jgi:hypothetical protein
MAENKNESTDASVEGYIASRANEQQRADCKESIALLKRVTARATCRWLSCGDEAALWAEQRRLTPSLALRLKPSWYRSRIARLGKEFTWNKH